MLDDAADFVEAGLNQPFIRELHAAGFLESEEEDHRIERIEDLFREKISFGGNDRVNLKHFGERFMDCGECLVGGHNSFLRG